ncbi:hypothetical protein [Flagellimonas meishanensis]|uniref:hypothetical protein n=1 Tax=Flagellimonas meishanensis TaxID=2873264 RepID=UPI001CA60E16|nr:hypothetical protein [[Muricauda] meishanensis]
MAKSFSPHRADDSHTNLEFSIHEKSLLSRPLDGSDLRLALNYETFSLDWKSDDPKSLSLKGKTHKEVTFWLTKMAQTSGFSKPYTYNLHYELPYTMEVDERFQLSSSGEVQELIRLGTMAKRVLASFLDDAALTSEIRVWPHHFDMGAFAHLHDGSGKSVGFGMAIPDSLVDDFYFYISGYRGDTTLNTWAYKPLSHGKWVNNGFKGAVLPASEANEEVALHFFKQALGNYKNIAN